jgi:excisionase family DNA binding protein
MQQPIDKKKFLSVREAAGELTVGRTLVYGLMEAGELPYVRIGKTRRISRDALNEFIKKNTVGAV